MSLFEDQLYEMVIERQELDRRIETDHRERMRVLAQSVAPIVDVLTRAKRHLGVGFHVELAAKSQSLDDPDIEWLSPECEGMVLARFDANRVPGVHQPYVIAFQVVNVSRDDDGTWTGAIHAAGFSDAEDSLAQDLCGNAVQLASHLRGKNSVRRIYRGPLPPKNIIHRFEEALLHFYYLAAPTGAGQGSTGLPA